MDEIVSIKKIIKHCEIAKDIKLIIFPLKLNAQCNIKKTVAKKQTLLSKLFAMRIVLAN